MALADPERLAQLGAAGRAWYDEQRLVEEETLCLMYAQVAQGNHGEHKEGC